MTDDAQADPRADEGAPAPFPAPDGAAVNDFGMGLLRGDPACCELADTIPDGIYVLDTEGRFRFVNRTIVERSGMPRERFYDATYLDIILPKDHARVRGHFERVMAGGDPLPYVLDYGAAGDRTVSVEVNSRPIRSGGEVVGLLGISRDVTARRRAEEEHRRTARQLSLIMDCAAEHVVFHDTSLRMQWASRAAAESVGVTSDALRGRHCFEVWQQRDTPCEGCPVLAALDTGEQQRARMTTPDGHVWDVRAYPAHDADGTLVGAVEVTVDITGRAEAEDALRVSEEQYRALFHASADGVAVVQDGRIVTANEAACAIVGRPCDDLVGLQPMDLVMEADRPKVRRRLAALARGERMSGPTVYRTQRPDGSVRMVELYSVPIQWQGRPAAQSVLRDVTERVEAEQALRESEETYRALVQASPDAVAAADLDLRLIAASDQAYAMFGYAKTDEVLGRRITEFFPPQEAGRVEVNIDRTLREGLSRNIEYTMVRKDGSTFIGEVGAAVLRNADGEARGLIATIRDVTERKRAEEALRQSEANYRAIFNAVHDMVFVHEIETGDVLDFNRRAVEAYGFGPDERDALNAHLRARADAPYAHADQMRLLRRAADLGPQVVEWLAEDRYGRRFWVEVGVRLATIGGRECLLAVLRDISDRKEAEARARLLTTAVEQSTEGVAVSDVDGNLLFVNEAFAAMHGYRPAELLGKPLAVFHTPDQMPAVEAANECIRTEGEFAGEMWHCRRDGSVFPSYMHNSLLRDERGEPVGMVAAMRDITDRKEAEEALRNSEARYRELVEASRDGYAVTALDGTIIETNAVFRELLGYDEDALRRLSYADITPARWHDAEARILRDQVFTRGYSDVYEKEYIRKDGSVVPIEIRTYLLKDAEGDPANLWAFVRDITDRKQAEQALRESEARYRAVVEAQTELVNRFAPDGTITFCNEALCRYLGKPREELIGWSYFPLLPEDDRRRLSRALAAVTPEKPTFEIEHWIDHPDGAIRCTHWTNRGIFDDADNLVEYQAVGRDVTDRKRAEEALRNSEARYRAVVESQTELVCRFKPDHTLTFVNEAYCRYFGMAREDLVGREFAPLIVEADRERVRRAMASIAADNPVVTVEERVRRPDGEVRWQHWTSRGIFDETGRLVEIQGVGRDVTDRKQAEETLRRSEEAYRALFEESVDGIAITVGRRIVRANQALARLVGLPVEEVRGRDPITFIHPDDRDVAADRLARRLAGEPQPRVPSRYRVVQPQGPPRIVEIVSRHVEWQGQDALQTIVRDITEQVRLQEQLQQAMKMEAVGQLAGGIAHDFNNLMTGILCHAGLLKSETGAGAAVRETAELIEHAARRAAELTSQLLGFARRGKQQDVPVDLVGTVETSVRLLSQSLPPLVSVQTDFHAPEAYVRGDPVQVEQVVLNLAMNARDAMPDGGTVTFAVDRQEVDDEASEADAHARPGTYIVLTVADTGVGIPEDQHSRVFEPFFTTKPQGKGTGMGLAMVYGIVRNHGGWIEVDSAPGRGTTFRVFFPAAEPPADGEPPPDRPLGRATVADRGRVLVVDDEELVRNVLVRMLASVGFEAVAAASGEEAVAYYRAHGRDVAAVVIDFRMPGMDGRECYQALKAMDPDVRAVLATGGGAGESMQDLLDDGVDALVKKPFDLAGLDATLRRVLER